MGSAVVLVFKPRGGFKPPCFQLSTLEGQPDPAWGEMACTSRGVTSLSLGGWLSSEPGTGQAQW